MNYRLRKIKERVRKELLFAEGLKFRGQRSQDLETVLGNFKNSKHFKRFYLCGLKKVEFEFGLLVIARDLSKAVFRRKLAVKNICSDEISKWKLINFFFWRKIQMILA